jgi:starvation-inducible DNA-binding protein
MNTTVYKKMQITMADTYALYLKTQNYHWHVTGPQFESLHRLFESQYQELANAVDVLAERIRALGPECKAPATFKDLERLKSIKDGDSSLTADEMIAELAQDHSLLVKDLNQTMAIAQENKDEGTANVIADRIEAHEKTCWMLNASRRRSA